MDFAPEGNGIVIHAEGSSELQKNVRNILHPTGLVPYVLYPLYQVILPSISQSDKPFSSFLGSFMHFFASQKTAGAFLSLCFPFVSLSHTLSTTCAPGYPGQPSVPHTCHSWYLTTAATHCQPSLHRVCLVPWSCKLWVAGLPMFPLA